MSKKTMNREVLQDEIVSILQYGKYASYSTVAENIVYILEKCYGINMDNYDRNSKPWMGEESIYDN